MNCKPGDLAVIVVPPGFKRTLHNRIVEVGVSGTCQLGTFVPPGGSAWLCRFPTPWFCQQQSKLVRVCYVNASWLRPISGVPINEEQHDEVTA